MKRRKLRDLLNFIDTAQRYRPFTNEMLVGRATKGHREEHVTATKFPPPDALVDHRCASPIRSETHPFDINKPGVKSNGAAADESRGRPPAPVRPALEADQAPLSWW